MQQVSLTCLVLDLVGCTPLLMARRDGVGMEVRCVVWLPVGRLPCFHLMSSMMGLDCFNTSMM